VLESGELTSNGPPDRSASGLDREGAVPTNRLIDSVPPSATLAITARSKELRATGADVVSFGAGEPDFETPEHIREAAIRAIREGKTRYEPVPGVLALREAICRQLEEDQGLTYGPDQVVVGCGAKHAIYNLLRVALEPGDEVLVLAPYWVSYPPQVTLAQGAPVIVSASAEEGFVPPVGRIREAISPRTRLLILNSPANPTGAGHSRAWLEEVAEVVLEHDLAVISDEIYRRLVYDGFQPSSLAEIAPEVQERSAVVNGVSKAYAMTGWRIGWAVGPRDWIRAAARLQGQSTSNATSISQYAALAALTGDQGAVEAMRRAFEGRRRLLIDGLCRLPGVRCFEPHGAFYAFPDLSRTLQESGYDSARSWVRALLEEHHVATVPGDDFGAAGHVRFSYATSERDIERGLARVHAFVTG
jgi:aspartate aminotransferase